MKWAEAVSVLSNMCWMANSGSTLAKSWVRQARQDAAVGDDDEGAGFAGVLGDDLLRGGDEALEDFAQAFAAVRGGCVDIACPPFAP